MVLTGIKEPHTRRSTPPAYEQKISPASTQAEVRPPYRPYPNQRLIYLFVSAFNLRPIGLCVTVLSMIRSRIRLPVYYSPFHIICVHILRVLIANTKTLIRIRIPIKDHYLRVSSLLFSSINVEFLSRSLSWLG